MSCMLSFPFASARWRGLANLLRGGIGPGFVVNFAAGHGRVENTRRQNVSLWPHNVTIVLVERVENARLQFVNFARAQILDRAFAFQHHHRFKVMLVVHLEFGTGSQRRHMEGKPHPVVREQHPGAVPSVRLDVVFAGADFLEVADDHVGSFGQAAAESAGESSLRIDCSTMSSPASSSASSITRGASTLTISSWAPLVSMMRPRSKQASVMADAASPEPTSMPRIIPRPRVDSPCSSAIASRRRSSSAPLRTISFWNRVSVQKWRKAAAAVTKA